jgi:integrase
MSGQSLRHVKITKATVDRLPFATGGQLYYWDTDLPGFGLCVGLTAKSYVVQRTVGRRGTNRKTLKLTIGKHGVFTAEEARKEARDLLNRMARGEDPRKSKHLAAAEVLTLQQAWDQFCKASRITERSKSDYKRSIERDFAAWLNRALAGISGGEVVEEYARQGERLGKSLAARNMRIFRAIYNFAMALHEQLPPNPTDRLKKLRLWYRDPRRRTYIRPDQLPAWYSGVMRMQNNHARDYLRLLLFTGMRRSEGLTLRWENVDFGSKTLTVPRTKNGDPLILPLSKFVFDLLHDRRQRYPDDEWVFPGDGPSGRIEHPKKWVYRARELSSVDFTLHDLRRTFVTVAESLDLSAYTLKRLLNHRDNERDVTAGYIVLDVERLRTPMEKIGGHLYGLCMNIHSSNVTELKARDKA